MPHTIGFTGTSEGMTVSQSERLVKIVASLHQLGWNVARHGMCVGADAEFHGMCRFQSMHIIGHPGVDRHGQPYKRADVECDEVRPELPFLIRNRDIVGFSHLMLATPAQKTEVKIGSGTWATIRHSRKMWKPLVVIYPDGSLDVSGDSVDIDRFLLVALLK